MKHLGNLVAFVLLACNALVVGLLLLAAYSPYVNPVAHPVRSCLGLAFPLFLLANAGFLCFWLLFRRYRSALLPLAGFLLCASAIRTYMPFNLRTDSVPEGAIKLLSYNVMGFKDATKKDNPIGDYLKRSGADIICLQEYLTMATPGRLSQADMDRLLSDYPYHRVHAFGVFNKVACYSKYPILSARQLDYASESNGSVAYELKVGEDTLLLINNHLESNKLTQEDKVVYEDMLKSPEKEKVKSGARLLIHKLAEASAIRAPQADAVARTVAEARHRFVVVCGDFNDSPISYAHHTIARDLTDAFTASGRGLGISYNKNKFYFRIDNILTSKSLRPYNCTVDRSIRVSDHYPIWCYLEMEKETQ